MDDRRLSVCRQAVVAAGDYLLGNMRKRHKLLPKTDHTTLTQEDLRSEEILISAILSEFPRDSIIAEESDAKNKSDNIWIVDPLCGTFSYYRGVETWSVSAAFVSGGKYRFGIVYQPVLTNIFIGEMGKGSTQNGKPISVSGTKLLKDAFISVEHNVFLDGKTDILRLIKSIKRIRVGHGSGAELSYVAVGHLDAVIKTGQSPEHYSGGRVILEAAGGKFIGFDGKELPVVVEKKTAVDYIASNAGLSGMILNFVK